MESSPSTNGDLGAGWNGDGSLTIQNSITVNSNYGYIGYSFRLDGHRDGGRRRLDVGQQVQSLRRQVGNGTLNIINGSAVSVGSK